MPNLIFMIPIYILTVLICSMPTSWTTIVDQEKSNRDNP